MRTVRHAVLLIVGVIAVAMGPSHTPVEGQTATPPILLVLNSASASPYGSYLAEILRTEGVNAFATAQLSSLTAGTLGNYRLALLAETSLTVAQASMFSTYVTSGGRLIAMRPDADLYSTLGITGQPGTSTNRPPTFLSAVISQSGPGAGLQSMTLPFRGPVSHYTLAGGTSTVATLSGGAAAGYPAVIQFGRTAAWSFDLARSVAYVRQGDPLDVNLDRDGQPVYRTNDIFYQRLDLQRVNVPHADVHMRLLVRIIDALLADSTPLPRLWYFPGTNRTIVIPTGDSHTSVLAPHTALLNSAQSNGARMSIYLPRWTSVASSTVNGWRTAGHEVGLHPYFDPDGLENDMAGGYTVAANWWQSIYSFPFSPTARHHSLEWTGWADPASVMSSFGVRMDTSYYAWGPALNNPTQASQAHGYINGSGQAMRFVTQTGQVIPVYQQVTALTDEQLITGSYAEGMTVPQAMAVSRQLIDESQAGSYAAIMTQFHVDYYLYGEVGPWADQTMAYAASLQIPMWPSQRWLQFVEARAGTAVANVAWSANDRTLTFTATLPAGAEPLTMLVPGTFGGDTVTAVAVDGQSVSAPQLVVNGRTMRAITLSRPANGAARSVAVFYAVGTPALTIGDITVAEGQSGTTVAGLPVTLSSPSSNTVTVQFQTSNGTATQPGDYQTASGTLTFNPFQTSQVAPVSIVGDLALEANETFSVTLSNPSNATIQDGVGIVTISDDDALPTIAITDVSVTEGNAGTTPATFTVALSHASGSTVSVQWATANGSAMAGSDYAAGSGTLTFSPGVTSMPLPVSIVGETAAEPNETFVVNLTGATGGVIGDPQGQGTIVNDDSGTGTTTATFQVQDGADDVSEEGGAFTTDSSTVWVGSAATASTSYAGLRFTGVTIPPGAVISSARLELRSASAQWLTTSFEFGVEAAANSAVFSDASRPSQRTLLAPRVQHTSDVQWLATTWYQLDELATLLQPVVSQPGWASGNAVSLIVRGAGQNWARKFATAFEGGAAFAPRLVVTYSHGGAAVPTLSINEVSVAEGNAGQTPLTFTVGLSAASSQTVTVNVSTANGSATAGSDFAGLTNAAVTFPPGTTSQPVTVQVNGDTTAEGSETFTVTLSSPVNATIADGTGQGTITNDDGVPTVSVDDVTTVEGHAGPTPTAFTVTLSAPSAQGVTVNYTVAGGTATLGTDFTATAGAVTLAAGATTQTIPVTILGDTLDEANETFAVTLTSATNATVADGSGQGTITDDDAPPAISINGVTVTEGNAGSVAATFTVSLSTASGQAVSATVATTNGSATAGSDYTAIVGGQVAIPAGGTTQTVTVTVAGDTVVEGNETFQVVLSTPVNATLGTATGVGTITNDDLPAVTISDVAVAEGNSGTTAATFTVTLSQSSPVPVSVTYATANQTATAGSDYTAVAATVLTFPAGTLTLPVTVSVLGDLTTEATETFVVNLTAPANATIADAQGVGTITNDDAGPSLSINSVAVTEGTGAATPATFTVTLSATSALTTTVGYTVVSGTAASGVDFTAVAPGTLTFDPGVTTQQITVSVLGDSLDEAEEAFTVVLGSPTNATIGIGTGTGTITDNDAAPAISINSVAVTEGSAGTVNAVFTVSLSAISGQPVSATVATSNGTATAGVDYTAIVVGAVNIAAGATSQTVTVAVAGDLTVEASETFTVTLSAPVNATLGNAAGTGTITNDDLPAVTISDVAVAEGNSGATAATFTVTLSQSSPVPVSVTYATANQTATAGSDYTAVSATTLTFPAGTTSLPVVVNVIGDTTTETNETFVVNLTVPVGVTIADAQGVGTITNDDGGAVTVTVTLQVAAGADDVNEVTSVLTAGDATGWLGNASSTTASWAGLRFANVTIPAGATITSARLETNAASTQWQRMAFEFAMEAAANSAAFTATSRPSQRTLLAPRVAHSTDAQWVANTWYQLEQIAPILQAAIAQPGWQPGNAVSLLLRGTGTAWGRKFMRAFEGGAAFAPRLVVTYTVAP